MDRPQTDREKGIINDLRNKARWKTHKCYHQNCKKDAIRSHIQQIKEIASVDRTIRQLENSNPFSAQSYRFVEKGINNKKGGVLTFWGFCPSCDSSLFKSIESKEKEIDFSLYRNQLLYSYRGFLSEFYKQEYNIKCYKLIFNSDKLDDQVKASYYKPYHWFSLGVKKGNHTKLLFEKDLSENTQNFNFIYLKLPKLEVCTSTLYSLPVDIKYEDPHINTPIFINLIPKNEELHVILGCLSDKTLKGRIDLDKIKRYTQKEQFKFISDLLIKHVETWVVSTSLYDLWCQRKMEREILRQIEKYLPAKMKYKGVKFNMFQNMI